MNEWVDNLIQTSSVFVRYGLLTRQEVMSFNELLYILQNKWREAWSSCNIGQARHFSDLIQTIQLGQVHGLKAVIFGTDRVDDIWIKNIPEHYSNTMISPGFLPKHPKQPDRRHRFLELFTLLERSRYPFLWAETHMALCQYYLQVQPGSQSEWLSEASSHCEQALEEFLKDRIPTEWARLQGYKGAIAKFGSLESKAVQLDKAIYCYRAASSVLDPLLHKSRLGVQQLNLGKSLHDSIQGDIAGNLKQAKHALIQAIALLTPQRYPVYHADACLYLGIVLRRLNMFTTCDQLSKSMEYLQQAETLFTSDRFPQFWCKVQIAMGNTWFDQKAFAKAKKHYHLALQVAHPEKNQSSWAKSSLNLAAVMNEINSSRFMRSDTHTEDSFKQILALCDDAASVFTREKSPPAWAAIQKNRGLVYYLAKEQCGVDWELQAEQYFADSLDVWDADTYPNERIDVLLKLAEMSMGRSCWSDALQLLSEVQNLDRCLLLRNRTFDGETHRLRIRTIYSSLAAYSCARLEKSEAAIEWIESAKLQFYKETFIDLKYNQIVSKLDCEGKRTFLIFNVTHLGSVYFLMSGTPEKPSIKTVFLDSLKYQDLFDLAQRFNRLQEKLRDIPKRPPLRPSELRAFIQQRKQFLADWNRDMMGLLFDIYTLFFSTVVKLINRDQELVLVPHKEISSLPLQLACIQADDAGGIVPQAYDNVIYLSDMYRISMVSSFKLFKNIPLPQSYSRFLGISRSTRDLPYAVEELDGIKAMFPRGKSVSVQNQMLKDLLHQYPGMQVVHFACHAVFDPEDPFQASLKLSESDVENILSEESDSWSLMKMFDGVDLAGCDLVVLSACETGLTEQVHIPDESIGLSTKFIEAGAARVMSSSWIVPDRSTYQLLTEFYRNLVIHKQHPNQALWQAQCILRRDPETCGILNWGAFRIVG